jgi:hypothetical protein
MYTSCKRTRKARWQRERCKLEHRDSTGLSTGQCAPARVPLIQFGVATGTFLSRTPGFCLSTVWPPNVEFTLNRVVFQVECLHVPRKEGARTIC